MINYRPKEDIVIGRLPLNPHNGKPYNPANPNDPNRPSVGVRLDDEDLTGSRYRRYLLPKRRQEPREPKIPLAPYDPTDPENEVVGKKPY